MIVIIGTGLAGYMLAKEWRKLDATTPLAIVSSSRGDFYSKPLLSTALTQKKTAAELAITGVDEMAKQLNATIYTDTVVESIQIEEKTLVFSGKTLSYDQLVLACGSTPIQLSFLGDAAHELVSVNDLEGYARFRHWLSYDRKKIAILGTGLVGCEFANDLLNTGYQVDMISLEAYPLQKFVPEKIGRQLQYAFAEQGARWHFNVAAQTIKHHDNGYAVHLSDGEVVLSKGVFSAVGLKANTELARAAGLEVNKGVVVDRYLQTSHAGIYALGDCAEVAGHVKQYVAPLLQCARTLAKILAGQREAVHYPCMPIVIKTPTCPLVTYPAPLEVAGEWRYTGEGKHLSALFFDQQDQLRGFALIGDKVRDKFELAKQLPLVFDER